MLRATPTETAAHIAAGLRPWLERLAVEAFGSPTDRSAKELRFGSKGSKWLDLTRGRWFDHEAGEGGDALDLVRLVHGGTIADALQIARERFLGVEPTKVEHQPSHACAHGAAPDLADKAAMVAAAANIWQQCQSLAGTLGERYFVEVRGVPPETVQRPHCLRWDDRRRMVVALLRDPLTDEPCGIHRTFLDETGQKEARRLKNGREAKRGMLGRAGVIKLSPNDELTTGLGVAEGIEDTLHILAAGWSPMWAMGTAGAINRLPVLDGIEALTIFADADEAGMNAARGCAARWHGAGREVFICPPGGANGR